MLRYKADLKTLLYFFITTLLFVYQWQFGFNWVVYIIYLHFSVAVSVITHNHSHLSIWTNKYLNRLTDWWLTVFYGMPIFVWIATHNRNHHRFNNKEGDSSLTYRITEENTLQSWLTYPSVSGYYQFKESIIPYMKNLKSVNRDQYIQNWVQIIVLVLWMVFFFVLDWKRALLYVLIPQQVSQFMVITFNYVQHVHADEESKYNHSRNFMGVNFFLLNNGYHTIHHEKAILHWSELPAAHEAIKDKIDPSLIEKSFWWYMIRTYIVSPFNSRFRSRSMRLQRLGKA